LSGIFAVTRDDKCVEICTERISEQLENLGSDGMTNKIELKERGWQSVDYVNLAQDRFQ
jgi:hypothetical protein